MFLGFFFVRKRVKSLRQKSALLYYIFFIYCSISILFLRLVTHFCIFQPFLVGIGFHRFSNAVIRCELKNSLIIFVI